MCVSGNSGFYKQLWVLYCTVSAKNTLSAWETPSSLFSDLCNGDQTSIPRFLAAPPTHSPAAKPSGSSQAQLGSTWPERFPLWTAAFIFLPPNLHPQAFLYTLFILSSKINHAKVSFLNRSGCLWKSNFLLIAVRRSVTHGPNVFPSKLKVTVSGGKLNPVIIL